MNSLEAMKYLQSHEFEVTILLKANEQVDFTR